MLASIRPDWVACLGHREGQKTPSDQPFQTNVSRPKRVLVVEDETLVALMMADHLVELGYNVVGPAFTISEARHLAELATLDAAIIDVRLHGIFAGEVADTLSRRQIPFMFITGYERPPPQIHLGTCSSRLRPALLAISGPLENQSCAADCVSSHPWTVISGMDACTTVAGAHVW